MVKGLPRNARFNDFIASMSQSKHLMSFVKEYDDFDFGCLIDVMDDAACMSDAYLKDIIVVKELFL